MERTVYLANAKKFVKEADAIAFASKVFQKTGFVIAVEKTVIQQRVRFGHLYSSDKFAKKFGGHFLWQVVTCPLYKIVWWHGESDSLFTIFKINLPEGQKGQKS